MWILIFVKPSTYFNPQSIKTGGLCKIFNKVLKIRNINWLYIN